MWTWFRGNSLRIAYDDRQIGRSISRLAGTENDLGGYWQPRQERCAGAKGRGCWWRAWRFAKEESFAGWSALGWCDEPLDGSKAAESGRGRNRRPWGRLQRDPSSWERYIGRNFEEKQDKKWSFDAELWFPKASWPTQRALRERRIGGSEDTEWIARSRPAPNENQCRRRRNSRHQNQNSKGPTPISQLRYRCRQVWKTSSDRCQQETNTRHFDYPKAKACRR